MSVTMMADYVISKLLEAGFKIQRYDSYSTNSVYLKLDYGVCNSIRISDHKGKKGLAYRYNLLSDREDYRHHSNSGSDRFYYGFNLADSMLTDIIEYKSLKILNYGPENYKRYMAANQITNSGKKGFWSECYEVYA